MTEALNSLLRYAVSGTVLSSSRRTGAAENTDFCYD